MWNKIKNWLLIIGPAIIGIIAFILGRTGNNKAYRRTVAELENRITELKNILQRERELTQRERDRISFETGQIKREKERLEHEGKLSKSAGESLERIDGIIRDIEEANKNP